MQPAGGVFHVLTRGVVGQPIFRDADDRRAFLGLFASVVERHGWSCLAFCLMTTHYHLLVVTPNADLARGMQRLNGNYAQGFNRRHGSVGHVFQSRYGSILVERDSQLLELFRYFALNPVRGGACDDPAAWPWGSYRVALGLSPVPSFLAVEWALSHFGAEPGVARPRLRAFVEAGLA